MMVRGESVSFNAKKIVDNMNNSGKGEYLNIVLKMKRRKNKSMVYIKKKYLERSRLVHYDNMRGEDTKEREDAKDASQISRRPYDLAHEYVTCRVQRKMRRCGENECTWRKKIYDVHIKEVVRFSFSDGEDTYEKYHEVKDE